MYTQESYLKRKHKIDKLFMELTKELGLSVKEQRKIITNYINNKLNKMYCTYLNKSTTLFCYKILKEK